MQLMKGFSLDLYPTPDLTRAAQAIESQLASYRLPLPPLAQTCVLTIFVPMFNESLRRLKTQLDAFAKQQLPRDMFEVVYLVNNGEDASSEVRQENARTMDYLQRSPHGLPIRLLDRSSRGQEILHCNVGKARNFGLHAIAKRYLEQERDGVLVHIDADTFPEDPTYLQKVYRAFQKTPSAIAASGGLRMILDMDNPDPQKTAFFKKHISALRNFGKWYHLSHALNATDDKLSPWMTPTTLSGPHMISRVVASVCAGGIPDASLGEDAMFGFNLEQYAKKIHGVFLSKRDVWFLRMAIRESTRAGASYAEVFRNIAEHNGRPIVRNPQTPRYQDFLRDELRQLQQQPEKHVQELALFFHLPEEQLTRLSAQLKRNAIDELIPTLEIWFKKEHLTNQATFNLLFKAKYKSEFPLTPYRLAWLRTLVYANPKRKAYAKNAIKYFSNFKAR
ncbi:MAG: glycosyltransferase family A protein [Patescibacteria group bacterium]